jgi:hypothetical protein
MPPAPVTRLALATLATWRLTSLVAREDGPADVIARLRERAGTSVVGSLMDCFACTSIWTAAPLALYAAPRRRDLLPTWLALSGGAIMLDRLLPEPFDLHDLTASETDHGMLWTAPPGAADEHAETGG